MKHRRKSSIVKYQKSHTAIVSYIAKEYVSLLIGLYKKIFYMLKLDCYIYEVMHPGGSKCVCSDTWIIGDWITQAEIGNMFS